MIIQRNIQLLSPAGRPFELDLYDPDLPEIKVPVVVFCHGFKGFKDWGHWDRIAREIAGAGCLFVKFNFSHNGISGEPFDVFTDLDAFGNNNYSKELQDLQAVLNWLTSDPGHAMSQIDTDRIVLIGHSRGGALALVAAAEDHRIKGLVTWAAVSRLDYAWLQPGHTEQWHREGQYKVVNGRTGQEMPLYYQLYEDFVQHGDRFDTKKQSRNLHYPVLIIHGSADPAVPVSAAYELREMISDAELSIIEGADHVFGGRHPFQSDQLPSESRQLVEQTINYLKKCGFLA